MTANVEANSLPGCQDLIQGIEAFVSEYVANPAYQPRFPSGSKIIHDTLWGTIRLEPWEVAILDLPLFQRLRQISQTSLVSYVFPGCRHSRFEHTLGVIHQTQNLANVINQLHGDDPPFDNNTVRDLRLAALFHDAGHSCFSHISEYLYKHLPDMMAATAEGAYYNGCNAHEVMSALILRSVAVKDYLIKLTARYDVNFHADKASDWIVGKHEGLGFEYLTQVINGPFDADKLDYVFRDAHFSGLPVSLDLDRLWASCDVQTYLPLGKRILTLHQASATPLEQILFSRINLFTVVYQHPKVRASECMFQAVVDLVQRTEGFALCDKPLKQATDFLWVTDASFFAEAGKYASTHPLHKIIHDILYRRHLVRALTITRDTCDSDGVFFNELRRYNHPSVEDRQKRGELAAAIWKEAGEPCEPYLVWVDLPPSPTIRSGADDTYIRTAGSEIRPLTNPFPMNYWVDSYMEHKWRGHVFCPSDCQRKVYDASRKVFEKMFQLRFNKFAGELSHVPIA